MSSCVTKIVDRELTLDVPKGDLCEELGAYDSSGDGILTPADLLEYPEVLPEESTEQLLHSVVVSAFLRHGVINEKQEKAVLNYFDLYNRVDELNKIILAGSKKFGKSWSQSNIDTWGGELEFEPKYWKKSVQPVIEDGGLFSNSFGLKIYDGFLLKNSDLKLRGLGYQLSMALYNTFDDLGGVKKYTFAGGCSGERAVNEADIDSMPDIFQKSALYMMKTYNGIEEFLDKYDDIECEGNGCPDKDEFKVHNLVPFRKKENPKKSS